MTSFNDSFDIVGKKNYETLVLRSIENILNKSNFYKKKLINHKKINNYSDFTKIPFTTKKELLNDQEKYPPFGSNLCVNQNEILRVHRTSGTTNKPLILALSKNDAKLMAENGAFCSKIAGLKSDDFVVHCLNYCMWMGGFTDHLSIEESGAAVIPFGVGNSKQLIETIVNLKINTISSTPSYLNKLEQVLKESFNLKPKELGLKLGLLGTEGGLQDENYRKKLESTWGINAINFNFGVAEVWNLFGSECFKCKSGLNFISNGNLYLEIINPSNEEVVSLEKDAEGEMVISTINKEAQPLIRYRTGDIIKILNVEPCKCGHQGVKFAVIGRSDDMLTIKGINVFPSQIRTIINKYLDQVSGQFQIILQKRQPLEILQLKIEKTFSAKPFELDILKPKLIEDFKTNLNLSPQIEFVSHGTLTAEGTKSKIIKKLY